MTEYLVCHIENGTHYVLDSWASPTDARHHLATVVDAAWGEGAIVTIPTNGGALATDRAHVEIMDDGALGEYDLRIIAVKVIG